MKLFLDSSALIKLSHHEADSPVIESLFTNNKVAIVFLSEIAKIEFASTAWKKWRIKEFTEIQAKGLVKTFEKDYHKYFFVPLDSDAVNQSITFIEKYGPEGLRTLDSLLLATAVSLRTTATLFTSADKLLNSFFIAETLPTT